MRDAVIVQLRLNSERSYYLTEFEQEIASYE